MDPNAQNQNQSPSQVPSPGMPATPPAPTVGQQQSIAAAPTQSPVTPVQSAPMPPAGVVSPAGPEATPAPMPESAPVPTPQVSTPVSEPTADPVAPTPTAAPSGQPPKNGGKVAVLIGLVVLIAVVAAAAIMVL